MTDAIAAAVLLSLLAVGLIVAAFAIRRVLHRSDDDAEKLHAAWRRAQRKDQP